MVDISGVVMRRIVVNQVVSVVFVRDEDRALLVRVILVSEGRLIAVEQSPVFVIGVVMIAVVGVESICMVLVLDTPPLAGVCDHL